VSGDVIAVGHYYTCCCWRSLNMRAFPPHFWCLFCFLCSSGLTFLFFLYNLVIRSSLNSVRLT
jgi:hypothetical protein